jgi:cytoskeleton-associated protein 5
VFSKVDLVKGYHQVPVAAADVPKTAIITPFGLFEYLFMPFGLRNSAQTFQRLMDQLFGAQDFVFSYLDDHLAHSAAMDQHLVDLRQFFLTVRANGLMINRSKSQFGVPSLDFLGHRVSARGMEPLHRHVAAIVDFPPPTEVKGLQ